ncbi:MAG: serine hydrolase [Candidatus Poribacteria bacterium]|nr:serine hydrolase [Candidatus Poribacteria bacterium]
MSVILKKAVWTCSILLFASSLAGFPADTSEKVDIEKIIRERVDNGWSVGTVVGLIDSNGPRFYSYGKLSHGGDQPVDENTIYEIGSVTKVFTSLLLADMVEKGELRLDDPIEKFLPDTVKVPMYDGKKITLEHLATHTSGLPRMPDNLTPKNARNPYADYTVEQMYDFLSNYTLEIDIGSITEYSNFGAGLLGHILARKAGMSYEQLVVDGICNELKMDDTRITLSPAQEKRFAKGHMGEAEMPNWDFLALAGAGALRSSAQDMLKFLAANLGLNKTELYPAMQNTHKARHEAESPDMKIALGWHVSTKYDTEIIWHNGGTGGYKSFIGFHPKKKIGVVVLSNSTQSIDDIGYHLLDGRYELEAVRKTAKIAPEIFEKYVGKYELQPGVIFYVTMEDDKLMVQLTGQEKIQVFPESEDKFFSKIVDAQITFLKDNNGNVDRLMLHQGGRELIAHKMGFLGDY